MITLSSLFTYSFSSAKTCPMFCCDTKRIIISSFSNFT